MRVLEGVLGTALQFARDNVRGMEGLTQKEARRVIRTLVKSHRMGLRPLIKRIGSSPYAEDLIPFAHELVQKYQPQSLNSFYDGLLCIAAEDFDDEIVRAIQHIEDSALLERLYRSHIENITNLSHPLCGIFNFDSMWNARVLRFISNGDFMRAWEELKKANRGTSFWIPMENYDDDDKATIRLIGMQAYVVSTGLLGTLLNELATAMKNIPLESLTALPEGDFEFWGGMCRSRTNQSYSFRYLFDSSGYEMARRLRAPESNSKPWQSSSIKREGAIALLLDDHFRALAREKQRARRARRRERKRV